MSAFVMQSRPLPEHQFRLRAIRVVSTPAEHFRSYSVNRLRQHRSLCLKSAKTGPIILSYSSEKIFFQSLFVLITVQFFFFASA
jgi:hypothetical protein